MAQSKDDTSTKLHHRAREIGRRLTRLPVTEAHRREAARLDEGEDAEDSSDDY